MSSLRMRALEYIASNGNHMTYHDVASGLGENPQRVRGALGDASKEGYLSFGRDDVSGQGGYSLTAKGKARIVNGHQTINGKQAGENKKACDEREAAAHMMSAPVVVEGRTVEDELADMVAMREQKITTLQKRIDGLEEDREKQRTLLAAKIERIAQLEKDVEELQDCTADELVGTVAKLTQENAELRKEAADWRTQSIDLHDRLKDALSEDSICDYDLKRQPIGYMFVLDDDQFITYTTEAEARSSAEMNMPENNIRKVHLVAVMDTAELSVKWARS